MTDEEFAEHLITQMREANRQTIEASLAHQQVHLESLRRIDYIRWSTELVNWILQGTTVEEISSRYAQAKNNFQAEGGNVKALEDKLRYTIRARTRHR